LILEHGDLWGVTNDVVDDKASWGTIASRIRIRLTDRRYDMKKVVSLSLPSSSLLSADTPQLVDGMWTSIKTEDGETMVADREDPLDIIQLCEALVDIVPDAGIKVTLPMMGRVAVLVCHNPCHRAIFPDCEQRQVLVDAKGGSKFWEKVDEQLSMIREKYENDEPRISRYGFCFSFHCRSKLTIFIGQSRKFSKMTAAPMATLISPSSIKFGCSFRCPRPRLSPYCIPHIHLIHFSYHIS
jgi:hypothetical protein